MSRYDDILNLPHHVSERHPHMSAIDRAAQFSPFAALTGYGDAVTETARVTDARITLDESELEHLNAAICNAYEHRIPLRIEYFSEDSRKAGGSYQIASGVIKRIDTVQNILRFEDGFEVNIPDICSAEYDESSSFS